METTVSIIVLNYNNALDTIGCIESLLQSTYKNFHIIVVDNQSTDTSINIIQDFFSQNNYDYDFFKFSNIIAPKIQKKITLILSEKNGGYGYGNNIGLKYSNYNKEIKYVWFLNNDTLVSENALNNLLQMTFDLNSRNHKVALIGSKIYHYPDVHHLQCHAGSRYIPDMIKIAPIEINNNYIIQNDGFNYIEGASIFGDREILNQINGFEESYFLFYEEIDLSQRIRINFPEYEFGYAPTSIIFHKDGSSTKPNKVISPQLEYYLLKNKILLSKRYYRKYVINSYFICLKKCLKYAFMIDFKRLSYSLKALFS